MPPAWRRYLRFWGPNVAADVVGLLLALGAAKAIGSLLVGVRPSDPVTFGLTAAALVAVGLAASYAPARRATRVNPTEALRQE